MNNVNIPRKQYHHGNLRQALIKAGLRAVAEDGPDGFSLRGVAKRAGVTAPAIYRHFKDKDELLAAIAAECNERLAAVVTAAVERVEAIDAAPPARRGKAAGAPSVERAEAVDPARTKAGKASHGPSPVGPGEGAGALLRFRHVGMAYVQFAVENPEHFRALTMPGLLARLPPEQRAETEAWHAEQRRDLEAAQRAGLIANIPVDELMLAANALVHGLAHLIVEGQLGSVDAERAKDLAVAVTGAFGVGLIPRDTSPGDPLRDRASTGKNRPPRKC